MQAYKLLHNSPCVWIKSKLRVLLHVQQSGSYWDGSPASSCMCIVYGIGVFKIGGIILSSTPYGAIGVFTFMPFRSV